MASALTRCPPAPAKQRCNFETFPATFGSGVVSAGRRSAAKRRNLARVAARNAASLYTQESRQVLMQVLQTTVYCIGRK